MKIPSQSNRHWSVVTMIKAWRPHYTAKSFGAAARHWPSEMSARRHWKHPARTSFDFAHSFFLLPHSLVSNFDIMKTENTFQCMLSIRLVMKFSPPNSDVRRSWSFSVHVTRRTRSVYSLIRRTVLLSLQRIWLRTEISGRAPQSLAHNGHPVIWSNFDSMLLYVHSSETMRLIRDGFLDFHTAHELWELNAEPNDLYIYILGRSTAEPFWWTDSQS